MTIEQLKEEETELTDRLSENRNKQRELYKIDFVEKYGADVGDTIEWMDGKTLKRGVVHNIKFSGVKPSLYEAFLFNADGAVGKRSNRIWFYSLETIKVIEKANG